MKGAERREYLLNILNGGGLFGRRQEDVLVGHIIFMPLNRLYGFESLEGFSGVLDKIRHLIQADANDAECGLKGDGFRGDVAKIIEKNRGCFKKLYDEELTQGYDKKVLDGYAKFTSELCKYAGVKAIDFNHENESVPGRRKRDAVVSGLSLGLTVSGAVTANPAFIAIGSLATAMNLLDLYKSSRI